MDIGMLWFDNDPNADLMSKVAQAADYYQRKYGEEPNLCFVHPSMLTDSKLDASPVTVCANNTVLPNHFWIGTQKDQLVA